MSDALPKADKFRFAIGNKDGPRSEFWFIHIEDENDVYASVSSIAGHFKLSLHKDRACHLGLAGKSAAANYTNNASPKRHYFFRWTRPETPKVGPLLVASIYVPTEFLNKFPRPIPDDKKLRVIFEPAPAGYAVEVAIFYSMLPRDVMEQEFLKVGVEP